jgi:carbamoyl-phosphate synthase large subunit
MRMPRRSDLRRLLIVGSGPIVIGQAAEFDFSGSQAALAVREEGYEVVLVNSNPATIQTDTAMADRVYIEPLTIEVLERIIDKERPNGILSGMGGQTALNLCSELAEKGILEKYGVELLGSKLESIQKSEDRDLFKKTMEAIGEQCPRADVAHSIAEAKEVMRKLNLSFPVLVRPAYTLGGTGGGVAYDDGELETIVGRGLVYSRVKQVLIEESVLGWKEFEYEVMRDGTDNCIIICNMENLDPMGIHTGESIVVAPAQTLSDEDHQTLRSKAMKIIRSLKIEGGCNVQFAVNPKTGEIRVIEVNPRVSRSSALASKATGYPIARVAAKIAVGLRLDEIPNSVTKTTPASFEPALDYIITKIPRWPFDKFRTVDRHIGTQMKSTGEVMAIGRSFEESLLKAVRSLETDRIGLELEPLADEKIEEELRRPTDRRLYTIAQAFRQGWTVERIEELSAIDPWFLVKIRGIVEVETALAALKGKPLHAQLLAKAKRMGFADEAIAEFTARTPEEVWDARHEWGILPRFKMVDTCAAEFEARTPYFYSTYEDAKPQSSAAAPAAVPDPSAHAAALPVAAPAAPAGLSVDEATPSPNRKVVIVSGGPIRIGQGIEFDYCCVHAVQELRSRGVEAIMINNNPETVSTDAGISDRLYFEPLTLEDVLHILERERPDGIILQFGGQTPINLAIPLQRALERLPHIPTKLLGTSADAMDLAEDRRRFAELMDRIKIPQPRSGTGYSFEEVQAEAAKIGYPVLVRPSYVLGGRGMEIVYDDHDLAEYMREAVRVSKKHPVLVDKYLSNAIEIDVDAVCDGEDVLIGSIQEHIEEAGVHSGDATSVIPPPTLPKDVQDTLRLYTKRIAKNLGVLGLVNIQFAVKDKEVYILEANPRASRTVPFVSKAIGLPMAKIATRVILGERLATMGVREPRLLHVAVKAPVFPFLKLPGVDAILTPEMKSTGEVMGIDKDVELAFYKAMLAAGVRLPREGAVYLSLRDEDKSKALPLAARLRTMGFTIYATVGTAQYLRDFGVECETAWRISEKHSPDAIDLMRRGVIRLIINTPTQSRGARRDGYQMRRLAVELDIPFITTIAAASAAVSAIEAVRDRGISIRDVKGYHLAMEAAAAKPPPA